MMSRSSKVATVGLAFVGLGFVLASVDPGSGPRTVPGAAFVGPFYLPPLLVALVIWVFAGFARSGQRWAVLTGGAVALVMLLGSAVFGAEAILYRLGHPGQVVGFVADFLQLLGEVIALVGGILALQFVSRT